MKYLSLVLLFVLSALGAAAQETPTPAKPPVATTTVAVPGAMKAPMEIMATGALNTVKGAPFSAEAVSETVQTLADGNRIMRSYTTKMYRDSEGRYRREGSADSGSSYVVSTEMAATFAFRDAISIYDPVEGVRYALNPQDKTARRMNFKPVAIGNGTTVISGGAGQVFSTTTPLSKAQIEAGVRQAQVYTQVAPVASGGAVTVVRPAIADTKYETKSESLGTRSFDGVEAEGRRMTTTIPAGAIGNERPIERVYEHWYSKELKMTVFSKTSDPRFGETTYRLTNINRSEPDRSLFVPPSDYKIVTEPSINFYTTTKPQ